MSRIKITVTQDDITAARLAQAGYVPQVVAQGKTMQDAERYCRYFHHPSCPMYHALLRATGLTWAVGDDRLFRKEGSETWIVSLPPDARAWVKTFISDGTTSPIRFTIPAQMFLSQAPSMQRLYGPKWRAIPQLETRSTIGK